jgi:hypothetical protein
MVTRITGQILQMEGEAEPKSNKSIGKPEAYRKETAKPWFQLLVQLLLKFVTCFIAFFAATTVCSMISSLWAALTNAASNWDGAR